MQVNLNCQTPNKPNFGMAIHSSENVNKAIKSRIKTKEQFAKLDKLIDRANKNDKVDIQLFVMPDSKTLTANVYSKNSDSDNYFFKSYTENALTKLFKGPVGFIEKLVNVADKKAKKIEMLDSHTYNDILSKME